MRNTGILKFPDSLLLGSATAGHQVEGDNIHSQEWCDAHHDEKRKAAGKGFSVDWWGLNYYRRHRADARRADTHGPFPGETARKVIQDPPADDLKAVGLSVDEMYPEGLVSLLLRRKDKPVIITENGYVGDDDSERIRYIALHLAALRAAMEQGVDVRVYCYWSTMDNWEWGSFVPRFGLVHVDYESFERTPKPSAYFYRDVIRRRGLEADLVKQHLNDARAGAEE